MWTADGKLKFEHYHQESTYVGQRHCNLLVAIIEELGYNKTIKDVSGLDGGLPGYKRLADYSLLLLGSRGRTTPKNTWRRLRHSSSTPHMTSTPAKVHPWIPGFSKENVDTFLQTLF